DDRDYDHQFQQGKAALARGGKVPGAKSKALLFTLSPLPLALCRSTSHDTSLHSARFRLTSIEHRKCFLRPRNWRPPNHTLSANPILPYPSLDRRGSGEDKP